MIRDSATQRVQVLCMEAWEDVMFSTARASGGFAPIIFFVVWIAVGKYILLSLYLAVIMEAFEEEERRRKLMAGNSILREGMLCASQRPGIISSFPQDHLEPAGVPTQGTDDPLARHQRTCFVLSLLRQTLQVFR
jgi:hypothetical protein